MRVTASTTAGGVRWFLSPGRLASFILALILAAIPTAPTRVNASNASVVAQSASAAGNYVGSQACARCHREIYTSYSRTDMGRSMSQVNPSLLGKITTSATIFDQRLNRHFETFVKDGNLYQSEYETNGQNALRDTHKVDWIIGAGANGFGAIVRRENYLVEAPLSFYSKTNSWALSPGYEFADYGFSRPILPGSIECHSGQPEVIFEGNGRFRDT